METATPSFEQAASPELEAVDFTVTFYHPVENDELVIDIKPYYPELCCFEIIAVENRETEKVKEVFVSQNKSKVIYKPQEYGYWQQEGAFDIVTYVII